MTAIGKHELQAVMVEDVRFRDTVLEVRYIVCGIAEKKCVEKLRVSNFWTLLIWQ